MKNAILLSLSILTIATQAALGQGVPGLIKATTKILPDGSTETTVLNEEEHTAEKSVKDAGGKLLRKTSYQMDERSHVLNVTHYDGKGTVRYKETYSRDAADRVSESALTSADGKPLGKRVFVYGDKDQVARIIDYDAQGREIAAPVAQPARAARPDKKRR